MTINWTKAQQRLAKAGLYTGKIDGLDGPLTYQALMAFVAGRSVPLDAARALAINAEAYGLTTVDRLAAFIGQTAHESGGYLYTREIWGPTAAQKNYDLRKDLGNRAGDGFNLRGAGYIQVTGRNWFDKIGHALGLDLLGNPAMSGTPLVAMLMSLEWWKQAGVNAAADGGDTIKVTKRVNGGVNGLAERIRLTDKTRGILA